MMLCAVRQSLRVLDDQRLLLLVVEAAAAALEGGGSMVVVVPWAGFTDHIARCDSATGLPPQAPRFYQARRAYLTGNVCGGT